MPSTSMPIPERMAITALICVPSSMRLLASSVTWAWMGSAMPVFVKSLADAVNGSFDFQDILLGFQQQKVHSALRSDRWLARRIIL